MCLNSMGINERANVPSNFILFRTVIESALNYLLTSAHLSKLYFSQFGPS